MTTHGNAKTTVYQRQLLIDRVRRQGWTQRAAAEAAGVSVRTVAKWVRRAEADLADRSSRPHRRAEQALPGVVQEAYVHGVSTRTVDDLVKALGLDGMSKSEVSRICGELGPLVDAFRTRPITGEHPYVWLHATYHKVRVDGRVVFQSGGIPGGPKERAPLPAAPSHAPRLRYGLSSRPTTR